MRIVTTAEMREIDRRAVQEYGMPSLLLMENAGRAVAERAFARVQQSIGDAPRLLATEGGYGGFVVVLCGKGNNGGDGFVAARHLHNRGVRVRCFLAARRGEVKGDARTNMRLLERLGVPVRPASAIVPSEMAHADLVIDALLGTGATGEPSGAIASAIAAIREAAPPVLSVDVATGVHADTGATYATNFVLPEEVVTFGGPRRAHLPPHFPKSAELTVAAISLPRPLFDDVSLAHWLTSHSVHGTWVYREPGAHKAAGNKLLVVAGSAGMTGAAALCCEAALRTGAGLVTLAIPTSLNPILEVKVTEAMTLPVPETSAGAHCPDALPHLEPWLADTAHLAIGPGLGRDPRTGELVRALLARPEPWLGVIDADGLNLLAPADNRTFPRLPGGAPRCVITPHPGEMARLLGTTVAAVQSNRIETARQAAETLGCVVVLKGPGTVIASPDGRTAVNSSGGPALATGGTGDVLTGMIGALVGQLPPYEAACAGVFVHGVAGEIAGERCGAPGTLAGDVVAALPEALRRLRAGEIPPPCRMM